MVSTSDLGGLASGLSSTNAQTLYKRLDPLGKGSLSVDDFAQLYAELADQSHQNTNALFGNDSAGMLQPTTFMDCRRTIFVSNFLAVREKAIGVFTQLDTDGSGSVSKQEFLDGLNAPATPSKDTTAPLSILKSATAQSQAMLAKYDTTAKGYLTQADLTAAYTADPTLGDVKNVPQLFAELDIKGSGHVSAGDLSTNALLKTHSICTAEKNSSASGQDGRSSVLPPPPKANSAMRPLGLAARHLEALSRRRQKRRHSAASEREGTAAS
jgi:Ca2+-binding EF-hand superfamily protein